jgi:hypothetical protein
VNQAIMIYSKLSKLNMSNKMLLPHQENERRKKIFVRKVGWKKEMEGKKLKKQSKMVASSFNKTEKKLLKR